MRQRQRENGHEEIYRYVTLANLAWRIKEWIRGYAGEYLYENSITGMAWRRKEWI